MRVGVPPHFLAKTELLVQKFWMWDKVWVAIYPHVFYSILVPMKKHSSFALAAKTIVHYQVSHFLCDNELYCEERVLKGVFVLSIE